MLDAATQQLNGVLPPQLTTLLQPVISYLVDSALTGNSSLLRFSNMNPNLSFEMNYQTAYNQQQYKALFDNVRKEQSRRLSRTVVEGLYRSLGYDDISAQYRANTTGGNLLGWGVDAFLSNSWNTGLSTIYEAAFQRRYIESPNGRSASYAARYQQLGDTLLRMQFQEGAFGNANFADVGQLTSALISSGRYDSIGAGADETPGQIAAKTRQIARDTREYTKALNSLRDVLGGDFQQMLGVLDSLFGGGAINMSPTRLQNMANNLRHAMTVSGMDIQNMATLSAIGFSYIAPFGGTETQGQSIANASAYYMGAGISVEGVKSDVYGSSLAMAQANRVIAGDARYMSAAFVAYVDAENQRRRAAGQSLLDTGNAEAYREFTATLRQENVALNASSLGDWLSRRYGTNPQYLNAILNSDMVTKLSEEHNMTLDMIGQSARTANELRAQQYGALVGPNGEYRQFGSVRELLGGDYTNMRANDIYQNVLANARNRGMTEQDARVLAERVRDIQIQTAWNLFPEMTQQEAEQTVLNAPRAERLRNARIYRDQMIDQYGEAISILDESGRAGGFEGILQHIISRTRAGSEERSTLSDMLLGAVGLSSDTVRMINNASELNSMTLRNLSDRDRARIQERYTAITGDQKETDPTKQLRTIYSRLIQNAHLTGDIVAGAKRTDSTLTDAEYEQAQNAARVALLTLQQNPEDREGREALRQWAANTENETSGNLVQMALDTNQIKDLYTSGGRERLQRAVDRRSRVNQYVNEQLFLGDSSITDEQKKEWLDVVTRVYTASEHLTNAQRSQLRKHVRIENDKVVVSGVSGGKLTVEARRELRARGFDDEALAHAETMLSSAAQTVSKVSAKETSLETKQAMVLDLMRLADSNDPVQGIFEFLQNDLPILLQNLRRG